MNGFYKRFFSSIVLLLLLFLFIHTSGKNRVISIVFLYILTLIELNLHFSKNKVFLFLLANVFITSCFFCLVKLFSVYDLKIACVPLLVAILSDTFAYITGKCIGGVKLCPSISPGKTVSGFIGGVVITFSIMILYVNCFSIPVGNFLILITILSAVLGDLIASLFKRKICIKDFCNLIPGHGGIIDRLDSIMMSSAIYYLLK